MWDLIGSASDMAHGYCLLWQPWLVALYAGSDSLIFLADFAIPVALFRIVRGRGDLGGYRPLILLFAAFILLCGLTHALSALTLWLPVYTLHGTVKLLTATVSLMTAAVLFPLVPRLIALPGHSDLEAANARLRAEILAHEATLRDLRAARDDLERRVADRTAELRAANERLNLVLHETAHRKKNLLAVVQSLAAQTARGSADIAGFLGSFGARLSALAAATDAILKGGTGEKADLVTVARAQLDPYLETFGDRIGIGGDRVTVRIEAAQQIGLAVHELVTNAIKHGALSRPDGRVDLSWRHEGPADGTGDGFLAFEWRETVPGGLAAAGKSGFGSLLLTQALPAQMGGTASRDFGPEGMVYRLRVPLPAT